MNTTIFIILSLVQWVALFICGYSVRNLVILKRLRVEMDKFKHLETNEEKEFHVNWVSKVLELIK